jgi:MFS family permease
MLIFARALQGSGAIIATGYSWVTGSISDRKRPRALSFLGIVIGFAAAASFALGPFINNYLTVKEMFLVCAMLILLVWFSILLFLKDNRDIISNEEQFNENKISGNIKVLLKNKVFLGLNLAGFFNNFIMVSVFYVVPIYLQKITGINGMWKIFMPAVIIAIIFMRKSIKFVERGYSSRLSRVAFVIMAIGISCYFNKQSFYFILVGSILFMIGYISLATIIPSIANDIAEDNYRGTANGIINSFQYVGSFVGSVVTGALWNNHESIILFMMISICIAGVFTIKNRLEG